jgi:DNA-directed RNA polymerase subunit H (RpoH/RPB5)
MWKEGLPDADLLGIGDCLFGIQVRSLWHMRITIRRILASQGFESMDADCKLDAEADFRQHFVIPVQQFRRQETGSRVSSAIRALRPVQSFGRDVLSAMQSAQQYGEEEKAPGSLPRASAKTGDITRKKSRSRTTDALGLAAARVEPDALHGLWEPLFVMIASRPRPDGKGREVAVTLFHREYQPDSVSRQMYAHFVKDPNLLWDALRALRTPFRGSGFAALAKGGPLHLQRLIVVLPDRGKTTRMPKLPAKVWTVLWEVTYDYLLGDATSSRLCRAHRPLNSEEAKHALHLWGKIRPYSLKAEHLPELDSHDAMVLGQQLTPGTVVEIGGEQLRVVL